MLRLGDLTPDEIARLQQIANEYGTPIGVFGSAARGTRRGVGTSLPLGKGPGTRSDIDLGIPGHMRGGPMEEALNGEFGPDIDAHGILSYFPPKGANEIEITPDEG